MSLCRETFVGFYFGCLIWVEFSQFGSSLYFSYFSVSGYVYCRLGPCSTVLSSEVIDMGVVPVVNLLINVSF